MASVRLGWSATPRFLYCTISLGRHAARSLFEALRFGNGHVANDVSGLENQADHSHWRAKSVSNQSVYSRQW
jgi:hypothetical protein